MSRAETTPSREFYTGFFRSIPDPIFIRDIRGHIIAANNTFCKLAGISPDHVRGRSLQEFFPGEVCTLFDKDSQDTGDLEVSWSPTYGLETPYLVSRRPVTVGARTLFLYVMHDISPFRKAEEAYRETEMFSDTLINNLPSPILIHVNGEVVFVNDIMSTLTGLPKDEIIGQKLSELFSDPMDTSNRIMLKDLYGASMKEEAEIEIRARKGRIVIRTLLLRNRRIRYQGKDAVLSIVFDITERKHLENYILGKIIDTEEKDRKQFAADLHDDLGPTLSSIKLHLGLLDISMPPAKHAEILKVCNTLLAEAIGKMRMIANNLMPRLIEKYGLQSALESFFTSMTRKGVFEIHFSSDLGNTRLPIQVELQFYRILCELVNNTIKHSGASKARVKIRCSKGVIAVDYTDNGKGYVIDGGDKGPGGMGIENIRQRVGLMNGQIRFISRNGRTEVKIVKHL